MNAKCASCGHTLIVSTGLIKNLIGGGLGSLGALGWMNYWFAGLLGFYGGALVIAAALFAGGGAILSSKDSAVIIAVGKKLTGFLNEKYQCPTCGHSSWEFSGYRDAEIITGLGHKQELLAAFQNANKELYIASGFLSSNVVDQRFLTELEKLLEKKTSITLIFSGSASHSDFMKEGYAEGFRSLEVLSHQHPNLKLIQKHTHQKGIVVDTQYAIVGSFNFLSNKMVTRQETSSKLYDQRAIENFKRELLRK